MPIKFWPQKTLRWLLLIVLIITLIFALLYFFLGPLVKDKLTEQVSLQTDGAYALTIDDLDINILTGNATAETIHLIPDTVRINRSKTFSDIYEVTAPEISISGLDLLQLLFDSQIEIDQLKITQAQVNWIRQFKKTSGEDEQSEEGEINELPQVKIGKILLNESGLKIFHQQSGASAISLEKASMRVENFLLAKESSGALERMINFDDLTLSLKDYSMKMPDSLNILSIDSLKASVKHATLLINGLSAQPRYGKYEYSRKKGVETDRIEFYNKAVYIKGLDFKKLKDENKFIAEAVVVDSINMLLYRDKTHPIKPTEKKKLIQQVIREAPVYLHIDSLQLNNAQITYQEKVEKETDPGNINFINLQVSINNVTNDSVLLKEGATMKAHGQTYVMGVGKIQADFSFPLAAQNNLHSIKGTASSMPMEAINPMLKYVAFAEIKSGKVNEINFEATLNEDESTGTMEFYYEDLKVDLLKKGEEDKKKGLVSLFANTFVLKSNNPQNGKFRTGTLYFERDKNKSMINYWWKTLFSGMKDTMGIPADKP